MAENVADTWEELEDIVRHIEITITSKLTVRSRKLIQKSRDSVFFNIEIPEF